MRLRSAVAVVTIASFLFGTTAPAFAADQSRQVATKATIAHSVTTADLHRTAQISHEQANAVRTSLNAFLARPDVKSQMSRFGIGSEKMASHVARLSDAELARVQQQLMAADLQVTPAGIPRGALIGIIVGGSVMLILIILWAAVWAVNDDTYYYGY
jgi:hypothetical protein